MGTCIKQKSVCIHAGKYCFKVAMALMQACASMQQSKFHHLHGPPHAQQRIPRICPSPELWCSIVCRSQVDSHRRKEAPDSVLKSTRLGTPLLRVSV